MSLADDVITALQESRNIGADVDDEHPMRHVLRSMKRYAEDSIQEAAVRASSIAHLSKQLVKDYEAAIKPKGDE